MKKNLLTLSLAVSSLLANAQVTTFVGDGAKMFVSSGTLVYSGGNWVVNSAAEKTVENRGNIVIVGDYKKGSVANAASDGKEFLNVYTSANSYGQVKILNTAGGTDARMAIQRPAASTNYFGAFYGISFPYKDAVTYVMKSFGLNEADFQGSCPIGVSCGGSRYNMTLQKWNNNDVVQDAVLTSDNFKPGDYYSVNLRLGNLQSAMTGNVAYKGTAAPGLYEAKGQSIIKGQTETGFSDLSYNTWKTYVNAYNELYQSYLGYYDSTSKVYGKNVYRFGNPYTSNIDLSAIEGAAGWLSILNKSTTTTLKAANNTMIKGFYITKRTSNYDINWAPANGTTNVNADYYKATLDASNNWVGSAEALLIRPFETFNLNFPTVNSTTLGSRIVNVKVNFNDTHKTFAYTPVGPVTNTGGKMADRTATVSNPDSFYQAEIFLTKDDSVIATPVYLVGSNYYNQSATVSTNANGIFVYGANNGNVAYDSKKDINEFNSIDYVGKPLGLGFNDLKAGDTYELRFNLYEGSIFNKVKDISDGNFYLLDKSNDNVTEISADKSYSFVASDYMDARFEVYWKEVKSGSLGTIDSDVKSSTYIYKDKGADQNKIRFEKGHNNAKIEVYDMSGKLILEERSVQTSTDLSINLRNGRAVYVVKVTYDNGDVRNLKMIN